MTDEERLDVFLHPLMFVLAEATPPGSGQSGPSTESVLDFLCTPGIDSDIATLIRRYREISPEPDPLFAAPAEKGILEKLVWPLLHAKGSYMLGNYLGTISLCGMVGEMLAILLFEIAELEYLGKKMTRTDERGLFGNSFERLGQGRRVSILYANRLIDKELKDSFDAIRSNRRQYLHFW